MALPQIGGMATPRRDQKPECTAVGLLRGPLLDIPALCDRAIQNPRMQAHRIMQREEVFCGRIKIMEKCTHLQCLNLHHTWVNTCDHCVLHHQTHRSPTYCEGLRWVTASHFRAQTAGFKILSHPKSTSLWEKMDSTIVASLISQGSAPSPDSESCI